MMPLVHWVAQTALLTHLAAPYPFKVGETLRYEAMLGYFPVGEASVSVTRVVRDGARRSPGLAGQLRSHLPGSHR